MLFILICCKSAEKKDFLAFYIYWESKLEIDLTWRAEKIISTVWPHTPLCFFVTFFWVLFAPKNSGLNLDEPFQKIDFGDFGAFLGPNNAFSTHLRKFLGLLVMLIAFAFKFLIISAISGLITRSTVRVLSICQQQYRTNIQPYWSGTIKISSSDWACWCKWRSNECNDLDLNLSNKWKWMCDLELEVFGSEIVGKFCRWPIHPLMVTFGEYSLNI